MVNILICGGSGHVGALLAERLASEGHHITTVAFDRSPALRRLSALGIPHYHLDLTQCADEELNAIFAGQEVVINLVARISFQDRDWAAVAPVNVDSVRRVVDACLRFGIRRLVHFSSIDVLNGAPRHEAVDEQRALIPQTFPLSYPRSKRLGQQLVMEAREQGLDVLIIYPTSIIGPGDYALRSSNRILALMARGEMPVLLNAGLTIIDVRDVVDFTARAVFLASANSSYVLTGPWAHFREMAQLLKPNTGKAIFPVALPLGLLHGIVPVMSRLSGWWNLNSSLTYTALHGLSNYRYVSSEKARQELGFSPRPLAETVQDTYHWLAEQGMLTKTWRFDAPFPE